MTEAVANWRGWKIVSAVLAAAVAAYFIYFSWVRPAWDWDMVPYALAVLSDGMGDPAPAVARTWALVKSYVSPSEYQSFISDGAYRRAVYAEPRLLAGQLPLYQSKLGYVMLLKSLSTVIDPVRAMMVVSLASALGVLGVLFWRSLAVPGIATLAWLPLAKLFGLTASLTTPDTLVAFLYAAAMASLLSGQRWPAVALMVAGGLVRLDNVILNLVLCLVLLRLNWRPALVAFLGSAAAFAVAFLGSHYPGWWTQFHFTFVRMQPDLAAHPAFAPEIYLAAMQNQLLHMIHLEWLQVALAAGLLAIVLLARRRDKVAILLLWSLLAAAAIHVALYPSVEVRLHGALLFGLAVVLLHALRLNIPAKPAMRP